jgi:succinoglycan biosynthesis transport protein ExoP
MPDELDALDDQLSRRLGDYWAIAVRRRWSILLPIFLCWVIVWGGSWLIGSTYKSEALILVEQQKVPEQYVVPNVTVSLPDRLQSMTQQILSRTRLQATIDHFHLYPVRRGARSLMQAGDAVEQMRKDIKIELVDSPAHPGQLTAFRINYSSGSPELAQQVNSELTRLFIDENLKSQQQLSESTTAFLQSQLADARGKLEEQEARVRAFKAEHFGNLPSQVETNVQILSGLQNQLESTQRALIGAKQQKLILESLQQQYQAVQVSMGAGNSSVTSPETLTSELLDLHHQLENARSRYNEDYPDIITLKDKIARTEKLQKDIQGALASNTKTGKTPSTVDSAPAVGVQPGSSATMMQMQSQLKSITFEIENHERHEKELESQISSYRARLNLTPQIEQQLADVSRGYEESKLNYNSLLQKQNQSQLATSLEQRQQGQQFRILDPPSLPDRPSAPNHLIISITGLMLGFAVGAGITAFLEMTNVRIRQEKDLEEAVPLKVLIGIPHLDAPGEDRSRVLFRRIEIGAAVVMAIVMLVGNLYAFYKS